MKRVLPAAAFWLLVWQLAAMAVSNTILLVGPLETAAALLRMAGTAEFWASVAGSMLRIVGGLLTGTAAGILLASVSFASPRAELVLSPFVAVMKAVPVASFVILILIWAGNGMLSFFVTSMVVFPVLYVNTLNGLRSTDTKLLEVARVFRMRPSARVRYLYIPQLVPFLKAGLALAAGMSFKSGVAAEVIGQPLLSIGNGLYRAKIWLETADVFAWTAVVIFISWLIERLILRAVGGGKAQAPGTQTGPGGMHAGPDRSHAGPGGTHTGPGGTHPGPESGKEAP